MPPPGGSAVFSPQTCFRTETALTHLALSLVTVPLAKTGNGEFWMSDVHPHGELQDHWQFCLCGAGKKFIAHFVYHDEVSARRAAVAFGAALQGAVYVTTQEK